MQKDTILYVLTKSQEYLSKRNIPSSRLDAELLLADTLNFTRVKLYTHFDMLLNESEKDSYRKKVKERGQFKPVAYILNKKSFYKSDFYVNESVLIPRPETEELVEWVSSEMPLSKEMDVLDLCCGSGCIGISLKHDHSCITVSFSDISTKALEVAQKNSTEILKEKSNHHFIESNLLESFPKEQAFDVIVCNPPYIPETEKPTIMPDVLNYEPHIALFLSNPISFYNQLLSQSFLHLKENGLLYVETHHEWAKIIMDLSSSIGFLKASIRKDFSGKDRFVKFWK